LADLIRTDSESIRALIAFEINLSERQDGENPFLSRDGRSLRTLNPGAPRNGIWDGSDDQPCKALNNPGQLAMTYAVWAFAHWSLRCEFEIVAASRARSRVRSY